MAQKQFAIFLYNIMAQKQFAIITHIQIWHTHKFAIYEQFPLYEMKIIISRQ